LVQSVVEQQDNTGKALKVDTAETIDSNAEPLLGSLTDTWGVNTTEESLVPELVETSPGVFGRTPVDSGFGIKSGRVTPLGDGKAIKETERYPSPAAELVSIECDETTGAKIRLTKKLLSPSDAVALAGSSSSYVEVQPIDRWHSIAIKADVLLMPADATWKETGQISLPDKLVEIGVIWDSDIQKEQGSAGVDNNSEVISNNISWSASVEASVVGSVFGRPYVKIEAGYRGPAEVTVARTYHNAPPDISITSVRKFSPVYGTLTIHGIQGSRTARGSARGIGSLQVGNSVNYRRHSDTKMSITQLGPFEHSGVALIHQGDSKKVSGTATASAGSTPGPEAYPSTSASLDLEGTAQLDLPTSSTPLAKGQSYVLSASVSPWRYGIWVKEVRTAKVP
jgi:hypothetical protein